MAGRDESDRRDLDDIEKRVRIRVTALGHTSLTDWHRTYIERGGTRSYQWWRKLNASYPYNDLVEAAQDLELTIDVLIGTQPDDDIKLVRGGITEGRVQLNEGTNKR